MKNTILKICLYFYFPKSEAGCVIRGGAECGNFSCLLFRIHFSNYYLIF